MLKKLLLGLLILIGLLFLFAKIITPSQPLAANCAPGECGSNEYVCQYGTMCCTGGGCPSYYCTSNGCTFFTFNGVSGCWGCIRSSYSCNCVCDRWLNIGRIRICIHYRCQTCYTPCDWQWCGNAYRTGGTCRYCSGVTSCSWGGTIGAPACSQANGLLGSYYRDNPVGGDRFDGGLKIVRNDATVNFNWGSDSPGAGLCGDNFSAKWTGYVNIPSSGTWTFYTNGSDGMIVEVEGAPGAWTTVVSDWSDHAARESSGTMALTTGWYGIRVSYYENTTNPAIAQLSYSGPGVAKQIVPQASLRTCTTPCSLTAPGNPNVTAVTSTSAQLNWTAGAGGTKQLLRLDDDQNDVLNGCPGGVGTGSGKCLLADDNVPSGQSSYGTGSILTAGTRYYWRVVEYKDASCHSDFGAGVTPSFVTRAEAWLQVTGGDVFANHMVTLRVAPTGQNSRWMILARGSITGTSQAGWVAQFYPERNFDLSLNTPLSAPSYLDLWKNLGQGKATAFAGADLPGASGVYLISGNKTLGNVISLAGNRKLLIFVNGDLTVNAEILVPADSAIAFIASGKIRFAKNLTGGASGIDTVGGIFVAGGEINTAYDKASPDEVTDKLELEGSLISLSDTLLLDRNLSFADNLTTPAESVTLSAKYYVLLRSLLGRPKFFWQEVPAGY